MSRRLSLARPLAVGVAVLLLAGCAGTGGDDKLDPNDTPLAKYFPAIFGNPDDDQWLKESQEIEELVAACMKDEGFEYIPVDQSQYNFDSESEFEWGSKEYVIANGYGMQQSEEEAAEWEAQAQDFVDPNADYIESLSEGEQAAFYEVLWGTGSTDDGLNADGEFEWDWTTGGCYGAAQHQVQGENPFENDEYKSLFDDMQKMWEKLTDAPEMKAADKEWAACMADAGEPGLKVKGDAVNLISEELNEVYEANPTGELDQTEELKKLRERELELALTDFECAEKVNYTERTLEAQFKAEEQFIKDHQKQLDEILANAKK